MSDQRPWVRIPGGVEGEILAWLAGAARPVPYKEIIGEFVERGETKTNTQGALATLSKFGALYRTPFSFLVTLTPLGRAWLEQEVLPLPLMPDGFDRA